MISHLASSELPLFRGPESLLQSALAIGPKYDDSIAGVNWKRAQLQAGQYCYAAEKVKPERLQRAIEAAVEWLEAHPTRKSIAASRQGKKSD